VKALRVMPIVLFAIMVPAMGAEQVPSCDLFRKRFVEAPRILSLRLPPQHLHVEPPELKDDTWRTDGWPAEDDGEMWYATGIHCHDGKFVDVFSDIDGPDGALHPTFDLIARSIYAYTGWDAGKVVRTTSDVLKGRSRNLGEITNTELTPGAYAKIATVSFGIELD
jgi:hypothetical protein